MRAHYLQHVPFEGLGSIEDWLLKDGFEITCTRLYTADKFPELKDIDFLIVPGGPMSVNDESQFPWLAEEKAYIRKAAGEGIKILGICLGAQLIAASLGGKVFPCIRKEIGWFPVQGAQSIEDWCFCFPMDETLFHWHGETFSLPPEAILLASSDACRHQAFQVGRNVIGLQFHPEATPETVRTMVKECRGELIPDVCVQSEEDILGAPQEHYKTGNALMSDILGYLLYQY